VARYTRVLVKLSGGAFSGPVEFGFDRDALDLLADEIIAVAEGAHDPEPAVNGHLMRVEMLVALGRTPAAHEELAAAARVARELGLPYSRWHVGVHETGLAMLEGRFAEAEALIDEGKKLSTRSSTSEAGVTDVVQRFPLLLEQRRLAELRPAVSELVMTSPTTAIYRCLLARLESETGNHEAARDMLERLARDEWAAVPRDFEWLLAVPLLAEVAWRLGDQAHASQLYDILVPYASLVAVAPHFFSIGAVSRYIGLLAAALSRLDEAADHLERAAAVNTRIGARPWVAHAKADHARVLLARQAPGDREYACDLLREAVAIHRQLGMTASADTAAALLAESAAMAQRRS